METLAGVRICLPQEVAQVLLPDELRDILEAERAKRRRKVLSPEVKRNKHQGGGSLNIFQASISRMDTEVGHDFRWPEWVVECRLGSLPVLRQGQAGNVLFFLELAELEVRNSPLRAIMKKENIQELQRKWNLGVPNKTFMGMKKQVAAPKGIT